MTEIFHPRKILVIKFRHIGDVLLTTPVFGSLRRNFPDAYIAGLVNSGTGEVLTGNPDIDRVFVFDRSVKDLNAYRRYTREISFVRMIRNAGFDMTIDLTGGDRAALISFLSGARWRISIDPGNSGFPGKRHLYTHLTPVTGGLHSVLQNLMVLQGAGINAGGSSVNIYPGRRDRDYIKDLLAASGIRDGERIVHVHPTSRWFFKCWRDEYMAEIIDWMTNEGVRVILTSSPERKELQKAEKILSSSKAVSKGSSAVINLSGKTNIKELAAVSEVSDLFFGVDSAPMHIAASVGTPVVALFGPSGAFNWGPWDNNYSPGFGVPGAEPKNPYAQRNGMQTFGVHTVVQRDWDCVPCGRDGCNGEKRSRCLEDIVPEEIKEILAKRLPEIEK